MCDDVSSIDGVRRLKNDYLIDRTRLGNRLEFRNKNVTPLQLHVGRLTDDWSHRITFDNLRDLCPTLAAAVIGLVHSELGPLG